MSSRAVESEEDFDDFEESEEAEEDDFGEFSDSEEEAEEEEIDSDSDDDDATAAAEAEFLKQGTANSKRPLDTRIPPPPASKIKDSGVGSREPFTKIKDSGVGSREPFTKIKDSGVGSRGPFTKIAPRTPSLNPTLPSLGSTLPVPAPSLEMRTSNQGPKSSQVDFNQLSTQLPGIALSGVTPPPSYVPPQINDLLLQESNETSELFEIRRRLTLRLANIPDYRINPTTALVLAKLMLNKSQLGVTYDPEVETAITYLAMLLQR